MTVRPEDIKPFRTAFGRNLLAEIPNFVADPFLVVTMEDLWPRLKSQFPPGTDVWFVHSMERADLEAALPQVKHYASVIGLGGGQAIDAAKYFAWRHGHKLHQFPTSLSVDAMYGQRAGVRENQIVRYVGWAIPECVYFDYGILDPHRSTSTAPASAMCSASSPVCGTGNMRTVRASAKRAGL